MGTIVTDAWEARTRKEKEAQDKAMAVMEVLLEGYRDGELTLERMCHDARRALRRLPPKLRPGLLGDLVEKALASNPPKRARGNTGAPRALRKVVVGVYALVREREGLPTAASVQRETTAFERVSEICTEIGYPVTPHTVKKWVYSA